MAPNTDSTPFDTSLLGTEHMVCDLVYVPHDTLLLRQAEEKGARTLYGYWMTIWQGLKLSENGPAERNPTWRS